MKTSFETLKNTTVDEAMIVLAKAGLVCSIWLGVSQLTAHNLQQSGTQTEYRRKDEDETTAQQRRAMRAQFKEVDKCKIGREKARAARKAKLMKQYREFFGQTEGLTLTYNIN